MVKPLIYGCAYNERMLPRSAPSPKILILSELTFGMIPRGGILQSPIVRANEGEFGGEPGVLQAELHYHFVGAICKSGCDTRQCQTTA